MSIPKVITAKTRVKVVLVEAIGEPCCSALKQSRDRYLWRERELLKGSRDLQRSIMKLVALCCWPLMFQMLTLSPSAMKPPCPSLPVLFRPNADLFGRVCPVHGVLGLQTG